MTSLHVAITPSSDTSSPKRMPPSRPSTTVSVHLKMIHSRIPTAHVTPHQPGCHLKNLSSGLESLFLSKLGLLRPPKPSPAVHIRMTKLYFLASTTSDPVPDHRPISCPFILDQHPLTHAALGPLPWMQRDLQNLPQSSLQLCNTGQCSICTICYMQRMPRLPHRGGSMHP